MLTLIVIGVVFHIVYLFSIFDIYFISSLAHGMKYHQSPLAPPADRVVLILGDGLRADKLFELDANGSSRAPYLRSIIKEHGTWGISHSRLPTKTRAGHIAIISGFYEAIGAIPTRWSMDPVHFDSVFNQSRHTWSFGSPDILPIFQHEVSDSSRISVSMYPPDFEVSYDDSSYLDTWVFDQVKTLFHNATSSQNSTLDWQLRQNKTVFFLHLPGLDTNGHTHRPSSTEYYKNIELVDRRVEEMVNMFESFYKHDGKTSYIFTADHGMDNRGTHGDGRPDNTRTPIVAWGAGIHSPMLSSSTERDGLSLLWGLDQYRRQDVLQADVAPLMAHLIGVPYPANSIGRLPLSYLNADDHTKAESAFANAREILAEYEMKHDEEAHRALFFKPFPELSGEHNPQSYINNIQQLIDSGEYARAEAMSQELLDLALQGLQYYQTYNWLFLRIVTTSGFVGWCAYCLEFVLRLYSTSSSFVAESSKSSKSIHGISLFIYLMVAAMVWIQRMPSLYYAYAFFTVFFWNHVLQNLGTFYLSISHFLGRHGYLKPIGIVIGTLLTLEAMVYSFLERQILSVLFILISFWPLVMPGKMKKDQPLLLVAWPLCCWCTGVFASLSVVKDDNTMMVVYGGLLGWVMGLLSVLYLNFGKRIDPENTILLFSQLVANGFSVALVFWTATYQGKIPLWIQISNLVIVFTTSICPFIYRGKSNQDHLGRLLTICFAFAPLMMFLSNCYEMLFYVSLCTTLLVWIEVERGLYHRKTTPIKLLSIRSLHADDIRLVLFFLLFIDVSFFSTGSMASPNNFTLGNIHRFAMAFDSFLMDTLLIVKVLVPFLVVASVFVVLATNLDLPPFSLFLSVVTITDIQTIHFFYLVSDHGGWLNVGTHISHFCIAELFTIFAIILFFLSNWLVGHLDSTPVSYYLQLHY